MGAPSDEEIQQEVSRFKDEAQRGKRHPHHDHGLAGCSSDLQDTASGEALALSPCPQLLPSPHQPPPSPTALGATDLRVTSSILHYTLS